MDKQVIITVLVAIGVFILQTLLGTVYKKYFEKKVEGILPDGNVILMYWKKFLKWFLGYGLIFGAIVIEAFILYYEPIWFHWIVLGWFLRTLLHKYESDIQVEFYEDILAEYKKAIRKLKGS